MGLPKRNWHLVIILAVTAVQPACRPAPQPDATAPDVAIAVSDGTSTSPVDTAAGPDSAAAVPPDPESWRGLARHSKWLSQRIAQSVVQVRALQTDTENGPTDALRELFGAPQDRNLTGQGSGLIVNGDGHIMTNYHVIQHARRIEVSTPDGSRKVASRVGEDALTDLAVIKIEAQGLPAAVWGDSDALEVGEFVWAVGNPFGLAGSVSFGIISARDRQGLTENDLYDFLQTDAAINPGNSGGPLVDADGRVVGINTAIVGQSYRGIGFAIPSRVARDVYQQICSAGRVARGWIGVTLDTVPQELLVAQGWAEPQGAYVQSLAHRNGPSPGARAGLQAGDIILEWNGDAISGPVALARIIAQTKIGTVAAVSVVRNGNILSFQVDVASRP